jgi:hypothetical protein
MEKLEKELGEKLYTSYTLEEYEKILEDLQNVLKKQKIVTPLISIIPALLLKEGPRFSSPLDLFLFTLKIPWIISSSYMTKIILDIYRMDLSELKIDLEKIRKRKDELKNKYVTFRFVTRDFPREVLMDSVGSCKYWMEKIKEREGIKLPYSIEIVTEEETCKKNSYCKEFREIGFNVIEVPKDYSPPRAKYKARALNYAIQQTKNINEDHWNWHGDEETRCSESLVYGILQFILENKHVAGFGLIVYDIGWNGSVLSTIDALRTSFLFSSLGDIKLIGYPLNIFPGSNFIVRSDVEKEIGWDYRSKAEDLVFGKRIVDKYGRNSIGIFPGVAHESNVPSYGDYLGQRDRWIEGAIEALKEELSIRSKIEIAYGLISWFSSLPAIISSILNIIFQSGGVFEYGGILLGTTLSGVSSIFSITSKIYKNYDNVFDIRKIISSFLLESFAPYYSIFSKSKGFYIVKKF